MSVHPLWNDFPAMIPPLEKVSEILRGIVEDSPEGIRDDLSGLVLSSGKMLRPAFTLLSAAWGTSDNDHLPAVAASIELLHLASLIHDDVIDKAVTRRGVPTLHTTMGVKKAVLTGDYLLSVAMELAAPEYNKELIPVFLKGVKTICLGEIDQDFPQGSMNIGREAYMKRIRGKTAELFGLACLAGAQASATDKSVRENLYDLGILFGMAFQVEDDILDYTGKKGTLGKHTGKDLKDGIPTLPLIEALEERDPLVDYYVKHPYLKVMVPSVKRRILKKEYTARADATARQFKHDALELLEKLPRTDSSEAFRKLFGLLESRSI